MSLHRTRNNDLSTIVESFHTELGWMALAVRENIICKLTFGHADAESALAAVKSRMKEAVVRQDAPYSVSSSVGGASRRTLQALVKKLCSYAEGKPVDFDDVKISSEGMTDFGRRVISACRKIPYGKTATYGELAAAAGNPAAARAVGRAMASNRIPIIAPCHRVLRGGGGLGGFSAPGGLAMKRRLLELEADHAAR